MYLTSNYEGYNDSGMSYKGLSTFLCIVFFIFLSPLQAQKTGSVKQEILLGDKYFAVHDFYIAAEHYENALAKEPNNAHAIYRLAECYRLHFDYDAAEGLYKKAVDVGSEDYPLAQFYYALMLKTNGKYEEAGENFEFFIAVYEGDDEFFDLALLHYNGCILATEQLKKPIQDFDFNNLGGPVNTGFSDFAATIWEHDSSIVVTSSRKDDKGDVYGRLGGGFTNNHRFRHDSTSNKWEIVDGKKDKFQDLNTEYNDGAGVFTKDKNKYYFTSCNEEHEDEILCAIYVSQLDEGKWSEPEKLNENINTKGFWNAQPSLSTNDDTLFFVSKRPGGLGNHDIWYSTKTGEEDWGQATNIGSPINTPYIEMSPNYYKEVNPETGEESQILFFASNGHEGFGGLDVFMAKGEDLDQIRNIGLPFNSQRDDFYFVLGEKKGYMSTNRDEGMGNDDIFQFNIHSREAIIETLDKIDSLDQSETITIRGRILDDNGNPAPDVVIILTDEEGNRLKYTLTDEDGVFVFANLDPSKNYRVIMEEDGDVFTEIPFEIDRFEVSKDDILPVVDTGEKVIDSEAAPTGGKSLFENIYFDFDRYKLRSESKKVLRELAKYYKKYDDIKIEVVGNTDSYGSNEYNRKLARSRANAAVEYLTKKGVPMSALVIDSYGEDKPIATNANPIGRQLNRRVEFYITGGGVYSTPAMIYVMEQNGTLEDVAKKFGMTLEELRELNDIEGEGNLSAYTPIRVRRTGDKNIAPITFNFAGSSLEKSNSGYTGTVSGHTVSDASYNKGVVYGKDDGSGYYMVLPKNTLYTIAKIHNMKVDELKKLNNLSSDLIYTGQRLRLRNDVPVIPVSPDDLASLPDFGISYSDQMGEIVTIGGEKRYVTKEDDTFHTICLQFNLEMEELRTMNGLRNYMIRPGMPLKVYKNTEEEENTGSE